MTLRRPFSGYLKVLLVLVLLLFCSRTRASAQLFEVYGTLSVPRISTLPTGDNCSLSGCTEQYRSVTVAGIGGGITLRLIPLGVVDLGLDLRGSEKSGGTGVQTAMAGLKATFEPPVLHLRPYGQFSFGYFATSTPNTSDLDRGSSFGNTGAAYEVIGGVDVPVTRILDVRAVEIGVGQAFGLFNSRSSGLFTINTGLVLHF